MVEKMGFAQSDVSFVNLSFEAQLRATAYALLGSIDAAEQKPVDFGLIFV
jgi:hypothetical protein